MRQADGFTDIIHFHRSGVSYGGYLTTLSASVFTSPLILDSLAVRLLLTALVAINSEIAGVMHTIHGSMH